MIDSQTHTQHGNGHLLHIIGRDERPLIQKGPGLRGALPGEKSAWAHAQNHVRVPP